VACYFYQQSAPMLDATRYRPSSLLTERLGRLDTLYVDSQRLVMQFNGATDFPSDVSTAAFKPHFLPQYSDVKDLQDLRRQLVQMSSAKDAMKRFVMSRFETLVNEIQQKLLAHAATLKPAPTPPPSSLQTTPVPVASPTPEFHGLYTNNLNNSELDSRKMSLENAKQFLGVLQSSAENPENKKKLEDSISEIEALAKLFPAYIEPPALAPSAPPAPFTFEPKEPLNAEKVAYRMAQIRNSVRQAVLSSWAVDEAYDRALHAAEEEQSKCVNANARAAQIAGQLHLAMTAAITAGVALGVFFLLIGDWTQKSSTELLADPFCVLIKDCSASPNEVYETVEESIAARAIPGLESSRVFWHEGGALSAKREYLQLARERLVFEIGAAPFGTGFFISFRSSMIPLTVDPLAIFLVLAASGILLILFIGLFGLLWGVILLVFSVCLLLFAIRTAIARGLADVDRVLMKTPLISPLYEFFLRPLTYYRLDTTAMYLQAVQDAVSEAFAKIFGEQGSTLLPNLVPPTVMQELYRMRIR
jgi:hypothetical protein